MVNLFIQNTTIKKHVQWNVLISIRDVKNWSLFVRSAGGTSNGLRQEQWYPTEYVFAVLNVVTNRRKGMDGKNSGKLMLFNKHITRQNLNCWVIPCLINWGLIT